MIARRRQPNGMLEPSARPVTYASADMLALPTTAYVPVQPFGLKLSGGRRPSRPASGGWTYGRRVCLTHRPVRVTGISQQELRLAFDALEFDELDLQLMVLTLEGGTPDATVEIQSGTQLGDSVAWVTLVTFTRAIAAPFTERKNVTGQLRYLRWAVPSMLATAATFVIEGIGRRYSRG